MAKGKDKFTIELNSKELEAQLNNAIKRNSAVTTKIVKEIALDLAERSAELAPLESGDLRDNCHADLNSVIIYENQKVTGAPSKDTLKPTAIVGYSLPYALRQHEDLSYDHNRSDGRKVENTIRHKTDDGKTTEYRSSSTVNVVPGGQAKFLEQPFLENEQKYIDKLKNIPDEVLK
jgi:hypothetical protein